jgi:peptidoglycan/LPS O-acetylase OafA/YrhL
MKALRPPPRVSFEGPQTDGLLMRAPSPPSDQTAADAMRSPTEGAADSGAGAAYRPFLDGLRAVAVLAVIVYHLDRAWLPGGFLGVDIFFVLSGYLITMLLLAEHRQTGRIHLPAFWARRIRRLLPALLVMLVVMAILIDFGGDPLAIGQARGDLLSTLFYFANWHFIASGQSYFAQYLAVSPDRHTWSLAIEEQFYLFWPIVVAVILTRFRVRALMTVAVTVAVVSAVWMVVIFDPTDPSRAYYGTDSRIFEILIGALLAMGVAGGTRARLLRLGRWLAPVGLAVLITAFWILADDSALYYRGGAVLVALAAAALIAGLEGGSLIDRLLSVRPLVMIGLVSYGLYLWHFPIITFINEWIGPTSSRSLALLAIASTFGAAAISYVVVEKPIRRRGTLIHFKLSPARLARVVPVASGLVALVIVATTVNGIGQPAWAAAVPSIGVPPALSGAATIGGPGWRVGIVGDSVMVSAEPALQKEATRRGWQLISAAMSACPVGYEQLYDTDGTKLTDCSAVPALYRQLLAARPDVIVWHDLQSSLARRSSHGTLLEPGTPAWKADLFAGWKAVLVQFLNAGAQVVIEVPPLRSQQPLGCQGVADQARCLVVQSEDADIRPATEEFFASLNGQPGVYLIEVDSLLCPGGMPCPATVDGIDVRVPGWDQTHFTDQGATWFAPRLLDKVVAALRTAGPTSTAP